MAIEDSSTATLVAIASRSEEKAKSFSEKYKIPKYFSSY